jgi:cytochrome c oxidase subunit 3
LFTVFQAYEYINATFSMNDGVYGSIFYMTTGFHGIHVIIGTIFLIVCAVRMQQGHFFKNHHIGFTCAA